MKKIAFASGKGGAGKTTLSLSFHAFLKESSLFADCDVDAADAFLLMEKELVSKEPFYSGKRYSIDSALCVQCGSCEARCSFDAVQLIEGTYRIDPFRCEGCGSCIDVCGVNAITEENNYCGDIYYSTTKKNSEMFYACLTPGEDNSGKLVHLVRKAADARTKELDLDYLIIDAPPGIGCPLMASLTSVDLLVVVIESSKQGWADALRLLELSQKMSISAVVIINKSGLNTETDAAVRAFLNEHTIPLAGEVPFNEKVIAQLNNKELLWDSEDLQKELLPVFRNVKDVLP
jgi:MinD superfamily P-loop ATPase